MNPPPALPAFSAYGIELEYMIVDRDSLAVLPISDRLLGEAGELGRGHFAWSNEVVLHVIELKNRTPDPSLAPLAEGFQAELRRMNELLEPLGARLMPTAMHPWMEPATETRLWPHAHAEIYRAYDRIFDCRRHGWANLQSMHLNLPFADDAEFSRLHQAIRLVLPILPALAASSPLAAGRFFGFLDFRMENYRGHQLGVPETIGAVIPDAAGSIAAYRREVLAPMFAAIAPHDPENILRHEWLNARGAIPRFERSALEVRVIDAQECPQADLAIAAAASAAIRALYAAADDARPLATTMLAEIFQRCIRQGEQATIEETAYLAGLGFPGKRCTAGELWRFLIESHLKGDPTFKSHWQAPLAVMLERGSLASRILKAAGNDYRLAHLQTVYRELCDCLDQGRMF